MICPADAQCMFDNESMQGMCGTHKDHITMPFNFTITSHCNLRQAITICV